MLLSAKNNVNVCVTEMTHEKQFIIHQIKKIESKVKNYGFILLLLQDNTKTSK